ncbi:MAG TPA: peptidyl-prolyl cis-trans isomerase [Candidatus Acidoferrales bacterium]
MLNLFRRRDLAVRILLAVVLGIICIMMVVTLVPGIGGGGISPDTAGMVVEVGGTAITVDEVNRELTRLTRGQNFGNSPLVRQLFARQIVDQLIYERALESQAGQLGVRVTPDEKAERLRQIPDFFPGGGFIGLERYQDLIAQRFQMSIPEFEKRIEFGILESKVRGLITDGVMVTPDDIEWEFRRRHEKVKISFLLFRPEELVSEVQIQPAELKAYFDRNKMRYEIPEKRSVRYILVDTERMRRDFSLPEEELRRYYQQNLDRYRIQERVHAAHILFKTVGKSDKEIEAIRKTAESVLAQVKAGKDFGALARQYSEDTTREKGGDLGWVGRGQTVPEFEQVAFSLKKGKTSGLILTPYGFHIIKILERQDARVQPFDEVKSGMEAMLSSQRVERQSEELASRVSEEVRATRKSFDAAAGHYQLPILETPLFASGEPIPAIGTNPELGEAAFRLRGKDVSMPVRVSSGFAILTLKSTNPVHPATLEEARPKVEQELRKEKATELARERAQETAKKTKEGGDLAELSRRWGMTVKQSDPFTRNGSILDLGNARDIAPVAFSLPVGGASSAIAVGKNWVVFRLTAREEINREEMLRQMSSLEREVRSQKQQLAYDLFRENLREQLARQGKLKIYPEMLKRLTGGQG